MSNARIEEASDFINDHADAIADTVRALISDARGRGFWCVHRNWSALAEEQALVTEIKNYALRRFAETWGALPDEIEATLALTKREAA